MLVRVRQPNTPPTATRSATIWSFSNCFLSFFQTATVLLFPALTQFFASSSVFVCYGYIVLVAWALLSRLAAMVRFVRQAVANMSGSEPLDDASFGPQFGEKIDFTIVFGNTILTAIPAALMIAAAPIYMLSYRKATAVTSKRGLLWAKMVSFLF